MNRFLAGLLLCASAAVATSARPQSTGFFPIDQVRPGMIGTGQTVFSGDTLETFQAHIVGVLRNVLGPSRDLVLAKLEGGPLASTGVIQGMSGSPVYIDGQLLGAVSYALGSFPKEPFAGITPIGEMIAAVNIPAGPRGPADADTNPWPVTIEGVFARFGQIAARASAPVGARMPDLSIVGPTSLRNLAPSLRPIGAAMVVSGLDPAVGAELGRRLDGAVRPRAASNTRVQSAAPLRPGDPIGMSLVRGDLEMGATGTVTYIDGSRVYAFGHPFLNLGPTSLAMTRAHVYAILPSLDVSMKIAGLGPVIGTMSQDRAAGVGGILGAGPPELSVNISLTSDREAERRFEIQVLHDEGLTPLFAFVAVYNTLLSYERASGPLSIAARGSVDYGSRGRLEIDDVFTGLGAIAATASATTASMGEAATNDFDRVMPRALDLRLHVTEHVERLTIERAWLDTTRPQFGETHELAVLVRNYRGDAETIRLPVRMPTHARGPLTLLVSDAATLTALELAELQPARPASWPALFRRLAERRQNNRLYVRLIEPTAGTAVAGVTLPALPGSVRSILEADATVTSTAVSKTVVGSWERRVDVAISGSHEQSIVLTPVR